MLITPELIPGILALANTATNLLVKHFSPDLRLRKVRDLISDIHTSLKTTAFWIKDETDVNEEKFIEYMNEIAGMIGELLLEVDHMLERKNFFSRFRRNKYLTGSSSPILLKSAMPSFPLEKPVPVSEIQPAKPTIDSVLSNFSNIETQLNAAIAMVPNIESSIIFPYKGGMWIKNLRDFEIPDIYQLAKQDPVKLCERASISHTLAKNLVSYADAVTARPAIGTRTGIDIRSQSTY